MKDAIITIMGLDINPIMGAVLLSALLIISGVFVFLIKKRWIRTIKIRNWRVTFSDRIEKDGFNGFHSRYIDNRGELWKVMLQMVNKLSGGENICGTASLPNRDDFDAAIKQKLHDIDNTKYNRYICFSDKDEYTKKWYNESIKDEFLQQLMLDGKFALGRIEHHLGMDIFLIKYQSQKGGFYVGLLLFPIIKGASGWQFSSGYLSVNQAFLNHLERFFGEYLRNEVKHWVTA